MEGGKARVVGALAVAGAVLAVAAGIAFLALGKEEESWRPATEGLLGTSEDDASIVTLWETLDAEGRDGKRPRPASIREVAQWLDAWPYRGRGDAPVDGPLQVSLQSNEVRCVGAPSGGPVPREGDDEQTLTALGHRKECTYARWKVWTGETAQQHLNERHTVWVDQDGLFHGQVDYWQ